VAHATTLQRIPTTAEHAAQQSVLLLLNYSTCQVLTRMLRSAPRVQHASTAFVTRPTVLPTSMLLGATQPGRRDWIAPVSSVSKETAFASTTTALVRPPAPALTTVPWERSVSPQPRVDLLSVQRRRPSVPMCLHLCGSSGNVMERDRP
jgi:hypothetical protein